MHGILSKLTAALSAAVMFVTVSGGAFSAYAYDDNEAQTENTADVETDYSFDSTNSLGSIFANELSEKNAAESDPGEENTLGVVSKVIISEKKAYVRYTASIDSELIVALYDENTGAMITSARTFASPETNTAELTFDVSEMPAAFIVKAYLVDILGSYPLSGVYTDDHYNSYWQDFYAKTTHDFDPALVLNLDGGDQYNFMVYNENVKRISQTNGANQIISADDEALTYVIGNADSSITSLAEGDIFSLQSGEDFVIAKVKDITLDGTTATIKSYEYDAADVFRFIKIDMSKYTSEVQVENASESDEAYTDTTINYYEGDGDGIDIQDDMHFPLLIKDDIKIEKGKDDLSEVLKQGNTDSGAVTREDKVSVKCDGSFEAGIDFELYWNLVFNLDILNIEEAEISCLFNSVTTLTVKVEASVNVRIPIHEFKIPTTITGLSIYFSPAVVIDLSVEADFTVKSELQFGLKWTYTDGITPVCKKMPFDFPAEVTCSGTLMIGLDLSGGICFLGDNIFAIGLKPVVGVELSAERKLQIHNPYEKHECSNCISLGIDLVVTLQVELAVFDKYFFFPIFTKDDKDTWLNDFKLGLGPCEINFEEDEAANEGRGDNDPKIYKLKLKLELCKGYISELDNYKLIKGECPHYTYKVNVYVKDKKGNLIPKTKVYNGYCNPQGYLVAVSTYTPNKQGYFTTNAAGNFEVFLPEGYTYFWLPGTNNKIYNERVSINVKKSGNSVTMKNSTVVQSINGANSDADTEYQPIMATIEKELYGDIVDFDMGYDHSAAITEDGSLYMWGANYYGQLGDATTVDRSTPVKIMDNVASVSLGDEHSAAITTDGSLYIWGANYYGQLGNGTTEDSLTPIKILDNVASVSLGASHSAAITTDGSLYTWGLNGNGALGNGTTENSLTPVKILDNVASVSLGSAHSAAITKDGSLYMWGSNASGQLGNGTSEFCSSIPVKIVDNVASVSLGGECSAAITTDGSLYMWGDNRFGQLGNGTNEDSSTPIKILDNVDSVSLGCFHSAAITEDGSLYMWGYNRYGQLGYGATGNNRIPVNILNNTVSVSLGSYHSAAITKDGSLYTWGNNKYGQLGNGTTESASVPTLVPFFTNSDSSEAISYAANGSTGVKTASFSGLDPNGVYNFYSVMYKEGRLTPGNLLYIDQVTADSSGDLTVSFIPRADYADAYNFVAGVTKISLTEAVVSIPDISENGSVQYPKATVTCRGKTLVQGTDFDLTGDIKVTDKGEYNLIFVGKGAYTDAIQVPFNVVEGAVIPTDEDPVSAFVERLYTKVLNRASEEAGKADWVGKLKAGVSATDVSIGFIFSEEFANRNLSNEDIITIMYSTFFDREPDEGGFNDWVKKLNDGCSLELIFYGFTQSVEFNNLCEKYGLERGTYETTQARDKSPNLTAFVSRMYTKALGRAYDIDGLNDWTNRVITGEATYAALAHGFIFSEELNNKNLSNEAFVDTLYATFFDRPADAEGKADWLGKLDRGEYTREQVLDGFLGAEEFANLVKSFGL